MTSGTEEQEEQGVLEADGNDGNDVTGEWSHKQVLLLIELFREHHDEMVHRNDHKDSRSTKKTVWGKIAAAMKASGYPTVTWTSCDKKFRNLMIRYRKILDHHNKSGRGRKKWVYFDLLHDIYADSPATVPMGVEVGAGCSNSSNTTMEEDAVTTVPSTSAPTTDSATSTVQQQSSSTKQTPKKKSPKKRKAEMPSWFAKFAQDSKRAEDAKLELLQNIRQDHREQASDRLELLKSLNDNIAKLVQKL